MKTFLNFLLEMKFHSACLIMCVCVCVHNYFPSLDLAKQAQTCAINDLNYYSAIHSVRC